MTALCIARAALVASSGDAKKAERLFERDIHRLSELQRIDEYLDRLDDEIRRANKRALAFLDYRLRSLMPTDRLVRLAIESLLEKGESLSDPVLTDVLQQWEQLRSVRTYAAEDAKDWVDAIRVIDFAKENLAVGVVSVPINEASGKLFKDTKRIKKLVAPIDVLLAGDINAENRPADEVWGELGLFREEHPVRLSGKVIVEREGVCGYIDTPYIGLPAATIKRLGSTPSRVMTIENQTTFHSEARRHSNENVLLIYTAGMPNPPWREMYVRLLESLPNNIPVYHWGDVDEGGFRIASVLAREALKVGHVLQPWKMHPDDVPVDRRSAASTNTLNKMVHFAEAAGWGTLGALVVAAGFTVEQESLG